MSADQSSWPAHLRDDAPYLVCDVCQRKTWDTGASVGQRCDFPQPSTNRCHGHFYAPDRADVVADEVRRIVTEACYETLRGGRVPIEIADEARARVRALIAGENDR